MKKSKLIQIIKEEIENVLLEESTPKITPEQALEMLVKAIGPLKDSNNKPLNVGQLLTMDGLHKAVSKASAIYPLDTLKRIIVSQMKDAEKEGITGKVASDLANELFSRVRNQQAKAQQQAKASKAKEPQPQGQKTVKKSVSQGTLTMTKPKFRVENNVMIATITDPQSGKSAEGRAKIRGNVNMAQTAATAQARAKLQRMVSGAQTR